RPLTEALLSPARSCPAPALREPKAPLASRPRLPAPRLAHSSALSAPLGPRHARNFALTTIRESPFAGKPLDYWCPGKHHSHRRCRDRAGQFRSPTWTIGVACATCSRSSPRLARAIFLGYGRLLLQRCIGSRESGSI